MPKDILQFGPLQRGWITRPKQLHRPTANEIVTQVIALRRQRFTGRHIAKETGISPATVSRILKERWSEPDARY